MIPKKLLPISDEFASEEDYVEKLLHFSATTDIFQILCGGVHILDFFTSDPGVYRAAIPEEWQDFLLECEPMVLLDFLLRDDLDLASSAAVGGGSSRLPRPPPESLIQYVKNVRKLSLRRALEPPTPKVAGLSRTMSVGMKPKKIHEVANFAGFVDRLANDYSQMTGGKEVTHMVDFGSGQNYLGRTLASEPYNRHIIAVESKDNITGAKALDLMAGVVEKEKVMRNKKAYMQWLDSKASPDKVKKMGDKFQKRAAKNSVGLSAEAVAAADLRSRQEIQSTATYAPIEGKGFIHYVEGRLENGDLSGVLEQVRQTEAKRQRGRPPDGERREEAAATAVKNKGGGDDLRLMAVSIHSCGNLSHYGIRSMLLNPAIRAVAIVGCCYNLMTERLGPPTVKPPFTRPTFDSVNGRVRKEEERRDPQGFPMSRRVATYGGDGVRLNITARMMACQAPLNWTEAESQSFFYRHFYRAVLQRILLDRGAISKIYHRGDSQPLAGREDGTGGGGDGGGWRETPFNMSTNPVIIGSLRKHCYSSLHTYVRGAIAKLTTNDEYSEYSAVVREKVAGITDDEISAYGERYGHRKRELSAVWSLMAFSACAVESLIVTDRWLFLGEYPDVVRSCWVEAVFDYALSPRNLVVVGIKKDEE